MLELSKEYCSVSVSIVALCFTYTSSHNVFLVLPPALRLNILISANIPLVHKQAAQTCIL